VATGFYHRHGKRALDLCIAAPALAVSLPVMLGLAAAIRIGMGSPVVFRQTRPGLRGEPFVVYKFRTMNDARGPDGRLLPDEERLTRLGRLMRRLSLDELPQLVNVLRGEMSLVGPRPLLMQYLGRYSARQARRHEVKPGITGWAQVNGRNAITWEEKFEHDVWYVDHVSLATDLKILGLTILKVIRSEGIESAGYATMPEFFGSNGAGAHA
jgi:sugar transferase EpsL